MYYTNEQGTCSAALSPPTPLPAVFCPTLMFGLEYRRFMRAIDKIQAMAPKWEVRGLVSAYIGYEIMHDMKAEVTQYMILS